jgi:hypothetical protein
MRVFENRVLREVLGPTREEITAGWKGLHNEKLHNLYCSPNIITMIKSRRMRWLGLVMCRGRGEKHNKILMEKLNGNINWKM